ncbi:thiol reductant ABC exporter subunit CydC [Microcella alkalica]|uniref:thiol reductant ABC exporter subunit CydC n=1 Tax=Microcella alkalica TaxID=355930 RepID=UPI00145D7E2A|nr:thiol reductant ABC exporter subunit CydC [Microcella alkalica]
MTATSQPAPPAAASIRPVLRAAQPPLRAAAPALLLGALAAGSSVALLATASWLIARAAEQPPILFLGMSIVGVRAFAIGRAVFRYLERVVGHDAAFRALAGLRVSVFRRLLPVAPDGLRGTRSGDVLTTLVRDVDTLQDLPLRVVQPLVSAAIVAGLAVVGVAWLSPVAAAVLLVGLIATTAAATAVLSALSRDAERRIAPLRAELADAVLEYLARWETLRAFGADAARRERVLDLDARLRRAQSRQSAAQGSVAALVTLGGGGMLVATLLVVQPELAAGALTGPELALLVLVPLAIVEVVGALPAALGAWWRVRASAERVADVVPESVPVEIPVAPQQPVSIEGLEPSIRLRGVSARWPGAARPALAPLDLDLRPGDRVVLHGPSGAGKTTLAHVLVRFLEHEGRYELGGVDVRRLHPDDVRRRVVLLEQQPHLFDESIRQNLLFARDTATDAELLAVLERVGLAEWVAERGGLDAPVGERGRLVSGGQAQRLALARGLLCEAPVLVLDEPTANVDPERAEAVLEQLLGAAIGDDRAVLVISHAPVPSHLVTRRVRLEPAP